MAKKSSYYKIWNHRNSKVQTAYSLTTKKHRITHGRIFRTKRGRVGCYIYANGKRVGFKELR